MLPALLLLVPTPRLASEGGEIANSTDPISQGIVGALIVVLFVLLVATGMAKRIALAPAAVPAVLGAAGALVVQDRLYLRELKLTAHERAHGILEILERDIEWPTLSLFVFLFIVVGAAVEIGLIASAANGMAGLFLVGFILLGPTTIHFVTWPLAIVLVSWDWLRGGLLRDA